MSISNLPNMIEIKEYLIILIFLQINILIIFLIFNFILYSIWKKFEIILTFGVYDKLSKDYSNIIDIIFLSISFPVDPDDKTKSKKNLPKNQDIIAVICIHKKTKKNVTVFIDPKLITKYDKAKCMKLLELFEQSVKQRHQKKFDSNKELHLFFFEVAKLFTYYLALYINKNFHPNKK